MYEQAKKAAPNDRSAGAEQLRRRVDRLMSLPARVPDRKPDLRELLTYAADDCLALRRWAGRNEQALAEGEIRGARGHEAGDSEDVDLYTFVAARLLAGQANEDVENVVRGILRDVPADSSALLALIAALAQMGRIDEAPNTIQDYMNTGRLVRRHWKRLPHSFWLRVGRYPMPDEAVDTLRPYFVPEQAAPAA